MCDLIPEAQWVEEMSRCEPSPVQFAVEPGRWAPPLMDGWKVEDGYPGAWRGRTLGKCGQKLFLFLTPQIWVSLLGYSHQVTQV